MKKIILILAAVALLAYSSIAQENKGTMENTGFRERLYFGLQAGAGLSNVYDSKGENFSADPKLNLSAGGFLSVPIGKYIGIQPEFLFSRRGFKETGVFFGSSYELSHSLYYMDIPILVTLKPSEFITILAGPQYSFLTKRKNQFSNSFLTAEQEQEFENDNIRKNTLCFLGGFDINLSNLILGARVGWDIQDNNGDGTSTNPRYKNAWYQATLGIRF